MPNAARSLTTSILCAALLTAVQAQTRPAPKPKPAAAKESAATQQPSAQLPVTRVSLYKNGVGYFEHAGHVLGDQSVTIDFTSAQLNDVLQSLTAIDLNGGRISGAGYNSTTPLEQQLKALPLGLDANPTAVDFYNAIRGARVEVTGAGVPISGRLLSLEVRPASGDSDDSGKKSATEKRTITVVSDSGAIRSIDLTPTTGVRLLDTVLGTDVNRYLELLDTNRNQGLRHLTLRDNGTGSRDLHVSYISEVPIWKSTYRILFTNAGTNAAQTATLQGWSVVDNTTGSDWNNVQLSLIAGAPQSFIQPLSTPLYARRPEIPISQEAQLTPQTHDSAIQTDNALLGETVSADQVAALPMNGRAAMAGMGSGTGSGIGAGSGGNMGGGVRFMATESENYAAASIIPNTTTNAFDDFFEYKLTQPITIRKNESALVPILQTKIDAERVTLWSPSHPVALRALWITNTSDLTLDRGSFSIVEDGNFGGEGLLDPIHPKERRLLSYAADQAVRVTTESQHTTLHNTSVTAAKGVLVIHHDQVDEITYVVHNAAPDARTVVIEHPIHRNFTLDSDPKPFETTPTLYRYRVATAPGETVRLHVGERLNNANTYQLNNSNDNQFTAILNQANHNQALDQALQPILDARRRIADAQSAVNGINSRIQSLRNDEDRQRSNITALKDADKSAQQRFVAELNQTEDLLATSQKDLATADATLQSAKNDLANKIEALQIDLNL